MPRSVYQVSELRNSRASSKRASDGLSIRGLFEVQDLSTPLVQSLCLVNARASSNAARQPYANEAPNTFSTFASKLRQPSGRKAEGTSCFNSGTMPPAYLLQNSRHPWKPAPHLQSRATQQKRSTDRAAFGPCPVFRSVYFHSTRPTTLCVFAVAYCITHCVSCGCSQLRPCSFPKS